MKKRIALILASLLVLSVLLAACSGTKKADAPAAAKPADKQEITLNLGEEPPNLDSAKATDQVSFDVLNQVMEGLVRNGEGFKLLPGIAEKWTVDGAAYTFNLRKDAKWSDGKPVTAKDFKYAWMRALDPKTASDYAYQLYYIKGAEAYSSLKIDDKDYDAKAKDLSAKVAIETPDDYTIKVTLTQPTPYWLSLMSFTTYLPQREDIVTKNGEKYAADADKFIGNGPFVLKTWVHEDSIVLEKNSNYWDAANVKLAKATYKMIKENATFINMYEAGELDATGVPGEYIDKYKSDKGFSTMADVTSWYLTFNTKRPAMANVNLRKAVSAALDRKAFVDSIMKNGSMPAAGLVPASMAGVDGKTFRAVSGDHLAPTANKEEAVKYWNAAQKDLGVTKLTIKLLTGDSTAAKKYAQGVQEMLQNVLPGLTVDLDPTSFKVRLQRTKDSDFDVVYAGWGADYNDPMTFMNMWVTGGTYNDAKWSNKDYDKYVKDAETNPDNKVRMDDMAKAEKILMTELPIVPIYTPAANRVLRPYLKGMKFFPLGAGIDLKGAYVEGRGK
ncbi:MAG TPA: peptide ABC transporter substrate-binding protein [Symbiobacteriaceae bacterium]|jgi:oligopeptide transport system substrate-binding protein